MGFFAVSLVWGLTLSLLSRTDAGPIAGFWDVVIPIWPIVIVVVAVCVALLAPGCGMDHLGQSLLVTRHHGWRHVHWSVLRDHLIKAFFLPLMVGSLVIYADQALSAANSINGRMWFALPMAIFYAADVTFAAVGYISTFRALGAHIRSSNPYWMGWTAALICYPPFFVWLGLLGLTHYKSGHEWYYWVSQKGVLIYVWGGAILLLTAIYVWSTVVFGIRFSNLTNRGIVTCGPFRWVKHPAYISKNLSWWLLFAPFLSEQGAVSILIGCVGLLFVNGIYFFRARTEELHLSADPVYVDYANWIKEHGLLAKLKRVLR